jgi:hypothetical protein
MKWNYDSPYNKGGYSMTSDINELKKIIENKLAQLEREKSDLQEKLLVVGQVEGFANELEDTGFSDSEYSATA